MIKFKESAGEELLTPEAGALAASRRVEAQVGNISADTRRNILHMAGTAPNAKSSPDTGKDKGKEDAEKKKQEEEARKKKEAEEAQKQKEAQEASKLPAPGPVVRDLTSASAEGGERPGVWSKIKRYGSHLGGIGAVGGIIAGGSSVAEWPLLGRIPYLPQAAAWLKGAILGMTNYLGINTGTMATNSILAMAPTATAPIVVGGAGLYGLGKLNEYLNGKEKGGMIRSIWNGIRSPVDIPFWGLKKIGQIPSGLEKSAAWILNRPTVQRIRQNIIAPITEFAGNVIKPTIWGVGAAAAGAGILAPFTGGSSLVAGAAAYGLVNYLNNTGWFKGRGGTPAAPAGAAPAH